MSISQCAKLVCWLLLITVCQTSELLLDDPDAFFSTFDSDESGGLGLAEYVDMLRTMQGANAGPSSLSLLDDDELEDFGDINERNVEPMWKQLDLSGNGEIEQDEWEKFLLSKIYSSNGTTPEAKASATGGENATLGQSHGTETNGEESRESGESDLDPVKYAERFDTDGDGQLNEDEFLKFMGVDDDKEEAIAFFKDCDKDKEGKLNREEIAKCFGDEGEIAKSPQVEEHEGSIDIEDLDEDAETEGEEDGEDYPPIPADFYKKSPEDFPELKSIESEDEDEEPPKWKAQDLYAIIDDGTMEELWEALQVVYSVDGGVDYDVCTPLHEALIAWDLWNHNGHLHPRPVLNFTEAAMLLTDKGADLRHECEGQIALHLAAQFRHEALLYRFVFEFKTRVDSGRLEKDTLDWFSSRADYCPGGGTALHCAAYLHNHVISVSKILVGHPGAGHAVAAVRNLGKCHADERDTVDFSEVHDSFMQWNLEIPRDVLWSDGTSYYRQSLNRALSTWNAVYVGILLEGGLTVNARNIDKETALHVAALSGDIESCRLLLKAGSDVTLTNTDGLTPLHKAIQGGHRDIVQLIAEAMEKKDKATATRLLQEEREWRGFLEEGNRNSSLLRGRTEKTIGDRSRKEPLSGFASSETPDGGWKQGVLPELEIDYCDITTIDASAPDLRAVLDRHQKLGRPVLIRNAIRDTDWEFMSVWTREGLRQYGQKSGPFKVFRQRNKVKESLEMDMDQFLEEMKAHDPEVHPAPDWLVDFGLSDGDQLVDTHNVIVKRYFKHLYEEGLGINNYQFMVAPVQTGASPHFHYTSARLMVHGRARWFLWPLAHAFYSNRDIYDWYIKDYPRLDKEARPLECVQGPGDLMYVPALWGHGVLYLEDTIGMASLFRA